jgi:hypothetical protein
VSSTRLLGKRVALEISDPWDFGTEVGTGPFFGLISDAVNERVLVGLEDSLEYMNQAYTRVICEVRHEGVTAAELEHGARLHVNMTLLTAKPEKLIDIKTEDLRTATAAIGSLVPA